MFDNIGSKIKTLAKVICWIGITASFLSGVSAASKYDDPLIALLVIGLGSLFSWIGCFFTYGFGELIEKVTDISKTLKK